MDNKKEDFLLVIDCGGQYTQLIVRCLREAKVACKIMTSTEAVASAVSSLIDSGLKGVIISGGPNSIAEGKPILDEKILAIKIPFLGICYGMQWICDTLGGEVKIADSKNDSGEFGKALLKIIDRQELNNSLLFDGVGGVMQAWMSHSDTVVKIPKGFYEIASTDKTRFAAVGDGQRIFGVQFHPEVDHTKDNNRIISNFAHKIAGIKSLWSMQNFIEISCDEIAKQVGDSKVVCALSGGVDSTVTAMLLHKAIGDKLQCIFIDHGMMRKNEADEIKSLFKDYLHLSVAYLDESERFLGALKGVEDPEIKRKIIGHKFIEVFEEEAKKIKGVKFLAQGTLYPDVIESTSFYGGPTATIKSHHNVGGLPERMDLSLVEPLRQMFKDEVRDLARQLGIPETLWGRHPFPGPGLAVRILGEVTKEKLAILREADNIFISELKKAGLYKEIWQAFVALLPIKSVGVQGDNRTYASCCVLRAVCSTDGMTAESYGFKPDFLQHVSTLITNSISEINRVVYDVTSKPPSTVEWE